MYLPWFHFNFELRNFLWICSNWNTTLFTQLFLHASSRVSTLWELFFATDLYGMNLNERYDLKKKKSIYFKLWMNSSREKVLEYERRAEHRKACRRLLLSYGTLMAETMSVGCQIQGFSDKVSKHHCSKQEHFESSDLTEGKTSDWMKVFRMLQ